MIHQNQIPLTNEQLKEYKYLSYCKSISLLDSKIEESFLKDSYLDVESLEFSYYFNQPILNKINFDTNSNYHCNLKTITFGYDFNQEIKETTLPRSLEALKFGRLFNQELNENTFKNQINLKSIEFGAKFNNKGKPIKSGVFPKSLESLKFGYHFGSFFDPHSLPMGLKFLELGSAYYQDLNQGDILPPSLTSLSLSKEYKIAISLITFKSLPNLINLDYPGFTLPLGSNDEIFPCLKLLRCHIDWDDNNNNNNNNSSTISKLPSSLTFLTIRGRNKTFKNMSLPIGLKKIHINSYLTFDSFHNGSDKANYSEFQLEEMILDTPPTSNDIKLGLPKFLIPTFKKLEIPNFNGEFTEQIFPPTITSLTLDSYDRVFNSNTLPKSLKHLKLLNYDQPFTNIDSLPWNSLESLEFGLNIDCFMSLSSSSSSKLKIDTLFPVLESLIFMAPYSQTQINTQDFFQSLPTSIKYLKLERLQLDKPFNDESITWPPKLTTISAPKDSIQIFFNQNLPLPPQLEGLICYKVPSFDKVDYNAFKHVLKVIPEIKF